MYVFVDLHTVAQIKKKENTDQYDLETRARWDERREREREGGEPVQYAAVGRSIRTSIEPQIFAKRYYRGRQKDNAFFSRYPPLLPIVITGLVDV